MNQQNKITEYDKALLASLQKAYKKMLHEKMLRGEEVVIADKDGNIIHADAGKLYEEMTKE